VRVDVLLLDGQNRSALAVCRTLGKRGYLIAVVENEDSLAGSSRYCTKRILRESLSVEQLERLLLELQPRMLLPMTDRSLALAQQARIPASTSLPFPSSETLRRVQSKPALFKVAAECSINVPRTEIVRQNCSSSWSNFPAVLKDAEADGWEETHSETGKFGTRYLNSRSELELVLAELPEGKTFLLQERIDGEGVGVFALCSEGETLALFAHRRILEKPPTGGVSVLSEAIDLTLAPAAEAKKLLKALNWSGIAMVEFKGPKAHLMEINPRFWGSLQLSISAGVDFPWLLWLLNQRQLETPDGQLALERARNYQAGIRLRWSLGTLDHLIIRLKREGISKLTQILSKNELQFFRGETIQESFSLSDPLPFLSEIYLYLKNLFR